MIGFENTGQVLWRGCNVQHKRFQLVQTFLAVSKAPRADAASSFVQDKHIMMGVCPIYANVPHTCPSLSLELPEGLGSFYNGCSKQRPSNHRLAQESCQGKHDLFLPVEPCGGRSLSPAGFVQQAFTCATLCQKGLKKY